MTTKRAASKGVSGTTSILSPQATKVTKSTERRIKEQFFCPICEERIEEAVGKKKMDMNQCYVMDLVPRGCTEGVQGFLKAHSPRFPTP